MRRECYLNSGSSKNFKQANPPKYIQWCILIKIIDTKYINTMA